MLEINFEAARLQMVDQQVRAWNVLDSQVTRVMGELARERFTPEPYRNLAYADSNIPIGHGEIMLAPKVQGRLLQALQVRAGDRVFEIGTGTGYLTACLAALGGTVRSVDVREDFVRTASRSLADAGFDTIEMAEEDAHTLSAEGPAYEVILVTGSLPVADPCFPRRLAVGGRLAWIVGEAPAMRVELVTRIDEGEWRTEGLFETVAPPLVGTRPPRRFDF
ncbi:MAG: protein-L-isoaspartate O-methyltransferase family protein [Gammaproteobacteria bacterium]